MQYKRVPNIVIIHIITVIIIAINIILNVSISLLTLTFKEINDYKNTTISYPYIRLAYQSIGVCACVRIKPAYVTTYVACICI